MQNLKTEHDILLVWHGQVRTCHFLSFQPSSKEYNLCELVRYSYLSYSLSKIIYKLVCILGTYNYAFVDSRFATLILNIVNPKTICLSDLLSNIFREQSITLGSRISVYGPVWTPYLILTKL